MGSYPVRILETNRKMKARHPERILIDLIPRLAKFSREDRFCGEREKALLLYWDVFRNINSVEAMEGDNETRFMEWFVFDYRTRSGKFLWELFKEENELGADEERTLGQIEESRLSVYQICGVDARGATIEIEDLFTQEVHVIRDSALSTKLSPDEVLFGRVLVLHGTPFLTGAPMILPAGARQPLLGFLDRSFRRYAHTIGKIPRVDFMKIEGYLVNHFLLEYVAGLTEGAEARLFHMIYFIERPPTVIRFLESHSEFEKDTSSESKWLWWDPNGDTRGWLTMEEDALSFYATTQEEFARGQARLEAQLGSRLSKGEDLTETPSEIKMLEIPGVPRLDAEETSGPTDEVFVEGYFEEYYDHWLDTPIPDLGNRTPREVSRSASGKVRVEVLLQKMEELQFRKALDASFTYDFDHIRRKLGLLPLKERQH